MKETRGQLMEMWVHRLISCGFRSVLVSTVKGLSTISTGGEPLRENGSLRRDPKRVRGVPGHEKFVSGGWGNG